MNKKNEKSEFVRVCVNCGKETEASAKFCPSCGTVFTDYSDKRENPGKEDIEKPKQTSTWPMILVGLILLILFIFLILLEPWKISGLFYLK